MQNHILIVGAGEVGFNTAKRLFATEEDVEITVIEQSAELVDSLDEQNEFTCILGSGSCPKTLGQFSMKKVKMFFAVTQSDEVNLMACMVFDQLMKTWRAEQGDELTEWYPPVTYARVRNQDLEEIAHPTIPINFIINPERSCAEKLIEILHYQQLVDSIPFEQGRLKLYGIKVPQDSEVVDRSLREYTANTNLTIAAIRKAGSTAVIIPKADEIINAGDDLYIGSNLLGLQEIYRRIVPVEVRSPHVVIAGASRVGMFIAKTLSRRRLTLTIFDPRDSLMTELEKEFGADHMTFLTGDLTDRDFLNSEGIADADTIITCSDDDEENLVCALLSQRLGCKRALVVTNRIHYSEVIRSLGLEAVLSPRQVAVNELMQRQVNTRSKASHTLAGSEDVEVREFVVTAESQCAGALVSQLSDFKWPIGEALIASILRENQSIMPSGDTRLELGDMLFIVSKSENFDEIEKMFERRSSWRFW